MQIQDKNDKSYAIDKLNNNYLHFTMLYKLKQKITHNICLSFWLEFGAPPMSIKIDSSTYFEGILRAMPKKPVASTVNILWSYLNPKPCLKLKEHSSILPYHCSYCLQQIHHLDKTFSSGDSLQWTE